MDDFLRKYRDRLRIIIILYVFCERSESLDPSYFGLFRSEIKIQALDFLLRYPDFLSMELMDLMDNDSSLDRDEISEVIDKIYSSREPELRVEEMEKFFHGAYESIDEVIAFHVSIGFLKHESKKRTDGKAYDKNYYVTQHCAEQIENYLKSIPAVQWYFERCELIKKYFGKFSGSQLKSRQYNYTEYSNISYKSHIQNINSKVRAVYKDRFNKQLL
ncbi:hypothetical protein SAMN05192550_3115 [Flavobacterium glycines]|uniref:Uncharacterized protein n=2 Tax=Flavobacterium glycines TaxID=551990 RepID=A0A1B9DT49_9FLAO|nr:hypothetical protein [Flavobacterium glycines]OCB72879.1 hypothetical protein FBGL_04470 [Flavobacterium glycines]SDJ97478.1 hypothetical protein SAMN05192550_3115 [Flavobacterium glycines]